MTDGLLLIDKPAGWTSHDLVAKLRGVTGVRQIGHAGTLDPLATGLMILLFGAATKIQASFQKFDKTYEGTITLGARSATDDGEGPITATPNVKPPSRDTIERALERFRGTIEQRPPDISAKQIKGQRAYRAARRGKPLTLQPVTVTIHDLALLEFTYPVIRLRIRCSSGTYIRAIARDMGDALGIGGFLSQLRRTKIGPYSIQYALPLDGLTRENWHAFLGDLGRSDEEFNRRAVAIVMKDDRVLVVERTRLGRPDYFVFPGGGIKPDESPEAAVLRELKEEVNLDGRNPQLLFTLNNDGREELYFLIEEFSGEPETSGEERERMREDNLYIPRWIPKRELAGLHNLLPIEAKQRLVDHFKKEP